MSENTENKASRGSISQIIITALSSGSKYGYEICKEIERLSNGVLILKQPSLYSSLRRMEEQDLIKSYWQDSEIGGKRHYYSLTEKGQVIFNENKDKWEMKDLINNLPLNEFDFETNEKNLYDSNSTQVVNQENLFNLVKKNNDVELINESEKINEENNSFVQFDLFDQNINFIKEDSKTSNMVETYSNKYENLDNHQQEIEPDKGTILDETQKIEPITRSSIFGKQDNIISIVENNKTQNENIISNDEPINKNTTNEKELELNNVPSEEENIYNDNINNKTNSENDDYIIKYDSSKIVWENPAIQEDEVKFSTNDYKSVIGKLYNNSKLPDPYEENKFYTFKEIFPSANIKKQKAKEKSQSEIDSFVEQNYINNNTESMEKLNKQFTSQGIKIRIHDNTKNKNNLRLYSDVNKLNMVTSWFVSAIMLLEIIFCYIILKNSDYIVKGQTLVYFLGGSLAISLSIVATLENLFDRFKLVILKNDFKKDFTKRFLIFVFLSITVFAVCLLCGMQSLAQVEFFSYWLVPILISSNIITYALIYNALLKTKNFNN